MAAKEEGEVKILSAYLPQQLAPAEIEKVLKEIMPRCLLQAPKILGKVMKAAMGGCRKGSGKEVNEIAKSLLG